jgi:glycosyltransferase involved in cell wall biosynthesis
MLKPVRVLHLINSLDQYPIIDLLEGLNSFRVQSEIITTSETAPKISSQFKTHHLVIENQPSLRVCAQLSKLIKEQPGSILHIHDYHLLRWRMFFLTIQNIKSVLSFHQLSTERIPLLAASFYNSLIADSEFIKRHLLKGSNIAISQIQVIHQGTNPLALPPNDIQKIKDIRNQMGLKTENIIVGNHYPLTHENDHITLLKAGRKLFQKKAPVEFVFTGSGTLKTELQRVVSEWGMQKFVHFIEPSALDRNYFYQACDIVASASFEEKCSPLTLEAMSGAKPLIITKTGENPEFIHDGVEGYLVPCGFPERIETAVMRFQANPASIKKIGEAAHARVHQHFSWNKIAHMYAQAYAQTSKKYSAL